MGFSVVKIWVKGGRLIRGVSTVDSIMPTSCSITDELCGSSFEGSSPSVVEPLEFLDIPLPFKLFVGVLANESFLLS